MKPIAIENIKLDDKQLNKEIAKKKINPYFSSDRSLKVGFEIILDSHHINTCKLTNTPNYPEFGIEVRLINKKMKDFSFIYARLINQYKFKNQTAFSTRFDKQDADNQVVDETELFNNLNINHN